MKKTSLTFWMVVLLGLAVAGCSSPAKTTTAGPGQSQPTVATQSVTVTPDQEQPPAKAPAQSTAVPAPAPLTITTKQVQQNSETIQVDLSIPVIDGLQDSKLQQQLNNRFEQDASTFETDIETQAGEDIKEAAKSGYPFRQYNATTAYKVAYNQNGLLSITVDYYQFTGGAHGATERRPYNYDLETGKELSLQDLFKAGVNYKEILNREIAAQIKANPEGGYLTQPEMGFETIDDNQPFYLTDGGLVVYFAQYEIAPYVAGIPEFKIPFSLLKDSVEPRFTGQ
jgi:predicted small secreted protein